jgi:hypothetical protein
VYKITTTSGSKYTYKTTGAIQSTHTRIKRGAFLEQWRVTSGKTAAVLGAQIISFCYYFGAECSIIIITY